MKNNDFTLSEELILTDIEAENSSTAIHKLGGLLLDKGYVKETYPKAVSEREKTFPTGLPSKGVGVAIPHTDIEHVNKPAIAIGTLKQPVSFKMMGNPEENVDVEVVFMLAIKDPKLQLEMLQNLMAIIQKVEVLNKIKASKDPKEIVSLIQRELERKKHTA